MDAILVGAVSALWLGILTSISPCPLATNIAAISFIATGVTSPRKVLLTGILYTIGRTLTYVALGTLLATSVFSIPRISSVLQNYMNKLLGPVLILVGMFLLGLIQFNFSTSCGGNALQRRAEGWGVWGAGPLGIVFALSFCPVSAALFFGTLIPLSVKTGSAVIVPSIYGIGTGLPVFVFALLVALGAQAVSEVLNKLTSVEKWARWITGGIFIGVGIYYSLTHVFGLF